MTVIGLYGELFMGQFMSHAYTCMYDSIVFICHVCNNYLCYILCADRKPHKVNRPRSDSQEFLPENEYAEIPRSMVNPGKH